MGKRAKAVWMRTNGKKGLYFRELFVIRLTIVSQRLTATRCSGSNMVLV